MGSEIEVRSLLESDDRGLFSCGQADLDRFFHHFAGQNQFKHHLSVTHVAVAEEVILGFATVTAGSVLREDLPAGAKRPPNYPLPVLRLARLGVDLRAQKAGVGKALLRHVLLLALKQRDSAGCVGLVTDAKPEAVGFYERHGFVPLEEVREGTLLQGEPVPMFLPIDIVAATE